MYWKPTQKQQHPVLNNNNKFNNLLHVNKIITCKQTKKNKNRISSIRKNSPKSTNLHRTDAFVNSLLYKQKTITV